MTFARGVAFSYTRNLLYRVPFYHKTYMSKYSLSIIALQVTVVDGLILKIFGTNVYKLTLSSFVYYNELMKKQTITPESIIEATILYVANNGLENVTTKKGGPGYGNIRRNHL